MIHTKRLSFTIVAGIIVEILNKLIPLYLIHYAQAALGVQAFGYAQFGITLMELAIPLVTFGYSNYGTVTFSKNQGDKQATSRLVSNIITLKIIHALIALAGVITLTRAVPSYHPYTPLVISLSFVLLFTATELLWVQVSIQKVAIMNLFNVVARLISLLAVVWLVHAEEDATLYATLTLLANGIVAILTTVYGLRFVTLGKPSWSGMKKIFQNSWHYALATLGLIALERCDMLVAEHFFGTAGAGLYAGPQRINHSLSQIVYAIMLPFFSEMVVSKDKGNLTKHLQLGIWVVSMILVPACFGIWFVSGGILELILGPDYLAMAATLGFMVVSLTGTAAFYMLGMQVLTVNQDVWPLVRALSVALASGIGAASFLAKPLQYEGIALGMLIGKWLGTIVLIAAVRPYLTHLPVKPFAKALLPSIIMLVALLLVRWPVYWQTLIWGAGVFTAAALFTNQDEIKKALSLWRS